MIIRFELHLSYARSSSRFKIFAREWMRKQRRQRRLVFENYVKCDEKYKL